MLGREEKISMADIEIDYINNKRNIPFHLSPEEQLLYSYRQDITPKQLEIIRDQYVEQPKDDMELPLL